MRQAALHRTWAQQIEALNDPDVELTCEEFAGLLSTYKRLRLNGQAFDPAVVALMAYLERQMMDSLADSDNDADVVDSEADDSDNDHSMPALEWLTRD